jgi:hypothetical protein
MKKKSALGSVRPSPTASIFGIVGLAAMVIFALSSFSDMGGGGFMLIFVLVAAGGIIYYIANLGSFSKSDKEKIPVTAEDVIEVDSADDDEGQAPAIDFEAKLRKLESLKKDGLISEDEYRQKREGILKEKW